SDLKVNETNAEYLVRKFGELESKLETAFRECRSSGITIDNLEAKCEALAAENARLKSAVTQQIELRAEIKKAGRPPHADFWVQSICEAEEKV
ncbi:hNH endonuclease, partial [Escherichia coli]|nr:hNH endonuclease [Escherichia coli]